jgi:hypothetical protein
MVEVSFFDLTLFALVCLAAGMWFEHEVVKLDRREPPPPPPSTDISA